MVMRVCGCLAWHVACVCAVCMQRPELLLGCDAVTHDAADLMNCTALHMIMCHVLVSTNRQWTA
jgi:hypothetical protein